MRIIVIGADGQLGSDLCKSLKRTDLIPLTQNDIEISDIDSVLASCRKYKPEVIVNTASYIRVDDCEEKSDLAYKINAIGARNLAVAAGECGAALAHLSTDYVFGGDEKRDRPYNEFDSPLPVNVYGFSKLAGERFIEHLCSKYFIIRTSVLYGISPCIGKGTNFVDTVTSLSAGQRDLDMVSDQVFSTTYTVDLAEHIARLIDTKCYGVFHIVNAGQCSWYEFAVEVLKLVGSKSRVKAIISREFPTKSKRPHYTALANYHMQLLGMENMRGWQEALKAFLKEKNLLA
jgi:dTDP-4-dehydrorhamnose reductase